MSVLVIRSLGLDKEQAAILRVALAALLERKGTLSPQGTTVARDLAGRIDSIIDNIVNAEETAAQRRSQR